MSERCVEAANRLHSLILSRFVAPDGAVEGPDVCIRLNYRVWRFIKSYLRFLPWRDRHYYLQGQGYWISANLKLFDVTGEKRYLDLADSCAGEVLRRQTREGYWEFPRNEWKGRITTVEGCYGALALLWCARRTERAAYIEGARRWYDFLVEEVGFQRCGEESLAVNYFAGTPKGMVPNNSTLALAFFSELASLTGDRQYLEYSAALVGFLSGVQLESGELPYALPGKNARGRPHLLCFQYNAFNLLDLVSYLSGSGDRSVEPIIAKLGGFVSGALTEEGFAKRDCSSDRPVVMYYTAAVAAALLEASALGLGGYVREAERAYACLLSRQRRDGGFDFSLGDYGFLSDRRAYPLRLSMILDHLLRPALLEKKNGR